jgi:hypothetical protein
MPNDVRRSRAVMKHVVLISCVKRKGIKRVKSKDLYESELFRKSVTFARSLLPDAIYILSAKYGLLDLEQEIHPYDETLNKMSVQDVKRWAERVIQQLDGVANLKEDRFTFLAAERYRRFLLPHLPYGEVPMVKLRIGQQLHWLKERTK